ncbi:MAG TPA: bacteriohopanetetrol glucosamine biosynthesis glycosyltransferase HpnI [Candidatus Sulfotelmatobacter sp.]|nr:bacteriohopanetetrol glucosamine biosynthesis glycosyltransferase HpnI [Candidatus Sulfotelmatobacter sp.]
MIHAFIQGFLVIALAGCISSALYYFICLWTAAAFLQRRQNQRPGPPVGSLPPVSILKPLKGTDPEMYESFRSHCLQDYPEYEIVFGVSDAADPAVASVEWLRREFPGRNIRLVVCPQILGPNVKVSNLEQMAQEARYDHLIVNDSDMRVEQDYLQRVMAPLADPHVGMVTCLYRGVAATTAGSRLEALGIADFCASVLVAEKLERGLHFGLGSTLAFRRTDLKRIGGFRSIVDFLADDYELGRRIAGLGLKIALSEVVVETHLPAYDLTAFLSHQLRWARGVRDVRRGGYIGLAATFGIMWALLVVLAARAAPWSWLVLAAMVLLRSVLGFLVCRSVLQDEDAVERLWLLPIRDLIAAGVWIASFAGHTVTWRGDRFQLKNGRLIRV